VEENGCAKRERGGGELATLKEGMNPSGFAIHAKRSLFRQHRRKAGKKRERKEYRNSLGTYFLREKRIGETGYKKETTTQLEPRPMGGYLKGK